MLPICQSNYEGRAYKDLHDAQAKHGDQCYSLSKGYLDLRNIFSGPKIYLRCRQQCFTLSRRMQYQKVTEGVDALCER